MVYNLIKEMFMPIVLVSIPVFGSIIVAKINNMSNNLKTNSGSKSTGDAIDKIIHITTVIEAKQTELELALKSSDIKLNKHIEQAESRFLNLEERIK